MLAFMAGRGPNSASAAYDMIPAKAGKAGRAASPLHKAPKVNDLPRAVAPYDRDHAKAVKHCFDRDSGKPVSAKALKTLAQALVRYHLHPEVKFLGGDYTHRGGDVSPPHPSRGNPANRQGGQPLG